MKKILVSLTTTAARIEMCAATVFSLINQSLQPDCIVLNISDSAYLRDTGVRDLPEWLGRLGQLADIKINWTPNTGPYRKLLPTLRTANEDEVIITADDDIIYGRNWLSSLYDAKQRYPNSIIAARARSISYNLLGIRKSYIHWPLILKEKKFSQDIIITHGGGTVFSKGMIDESLLQSDAFMDICPTTDDLWFSMLILRSNLDVVVCHEAFKELHFVIHEDGLDNHNLPKHKRVTQKLLNRLYLRPMGTLGFAACGNDRSFRKLQRSEFRFIN